MNKVLVIFFILALLILGNIGFSKESKIGLEESLKNVHIVSHMSFKELSFKSDQKISSPFRFSGKAKGTWFFEGSFPVEIKNNNSETIATGFATSKEDWMTEDFVLFEGEVDFNAVSGENGYIVFKKDNPSGLSQNDDEFYIPIIFK
jgi:hypothetical protein